MGPKIRVLIADDHALLRQGLRQIISSTEDLIVSGEAGDGAELMALAESIDWDICLLDISMPVKNGIETLKQLRRDYPRRPVLILSMHPETQYAVRAIQSGAAGYLSKQGAPAEIIEAVRKAATGGKHISDSLAASLADVVAGGGRPTGLANLSDREMEVLKLMASGRTLSQVADLLNISVATVSTYRSRLLEKLVLDNTAELIRFGLENNLVE
jgi:two-component system invasion response regulator UvrY